MKMYRAVVGSLMCLAQLVNARDDDDDDRLATPAVTRINSGIVASELGTVLDLSYREVDELPGDGMDTCFHCRYFNLVEPGVLVGRGEGAQYPWPNGDHMDSWLLSSSAETPTKVAVIRDSSTSANLWVRKVNGRYYAAGGEAVGPDEPDYRWDDENRDGIRVFSADSLEELLAGAWLVPSHDDSTLALGGQHAGCFTARRDNGACMYDSKVSLVRHTSQVHGVVWLLYTRLNLKEHGGRYVQVATTQGDAIRGPYGPLEQINVVGYDRRGPSNLYFIAVDNNPLDASTLLGLMPVNEGETGLGNGVGESYIALSISCDGINWSSLTKLVWSTGREGRTYDHPVDGLLYEDGRLYLLMHHDVPNISPFAPRQSRIAKYELNIAAVRDVTVNAKATLTGCLAPPLIPLLPPPTVLPPRVSPVLSPAPPAPPPPSPLPSPPQLKARPPLPPSTLLLPTLLPPASELAQPLITPEATTGVSDAAGPKASAGSSAGHNDATAAPREPCMPCDTSFTTLLLSSFASFVLGAAVHHFLSFRLSKAVPGPLHKRPRHKRLSLRRHTRLAEEEAVECGHAGQRGEDSTRANA